MKLAFSNSTEVGELDTETPILICLGSLEQHGPNLPIGTKGLILNSISDTLESLFPRSLITLPVIWTSGSDGNLPFTGTVSAGFEGTSSNLAATIQSLTKHHFRRFFILSFSTENSAIVQVTLRGLKNCDPNLCLVPINLSETTWWSDTSMEPYGHGSHFDQSILSFIFPDKFPIGGAPLVTQFEASEFQTNYSLLDADEVNEDGVTFSSRAASIQSGRTYFETCIQKLSALIENAAEQDISFA